MTGMDLYFKFMFMLAVGLVGMGIVLTTLFESLLHDWDPIRDFRRWWRRLTQHHHVQSIRAEDILMEIEVRNKGGQYDSRLGNATTLDRRREALREVSEAEHRLSSPHPAEPVL